MSLITRPFFLVGVVFLVVALILLMLGSGWPTAVFATLGVYAIVVSARNKASEIKAEHKDPKITS